MPAATWAGAVSVAEEATAAAVAVVAADLGAHLVAAAVAAALPPALGTGHAQTVATTALPQRAPATVVGRPSLLMLAVTWVGVAMEEVVAMVAVEAVVAMGETVAAMVVAQEGAGLRLPPRVHQGCLRLKTGPAPLAAM